MTDVWTPPIIPHLILGIDPGGTSGWSGYEDGLPREFGTFTSEDFGDWLDNLPWYDLIICEDYIIRGPNASKGFQHHWNKGETLQKIGDIKGHCRRHGIKLEMQPASIKPIGAGVSGLPYDRGRKGKHHIDSMLHVEFYLHKNFPEWYQRIRRAQA